MNTVGTGNKEGRRNWLKQALAKIPKDSLILDAGAGESQYKDLCSHLKYVAQDFAQYSGVGDQVGLQKERHWDQDNLDIVSDILAIPREDGYFDAVMCVEVLEHIPEPHKAIQELTRVLKPGGTLILTTPFCSLSHFTPYYYYNGFSKYFYEYTLKEHFEILEISNNGNFYEWLAQETRRIPYVSEKYGQGKLPFGFKIVQTLMLKMLAKFSKWDRSSDDLLLFGIHVLAKKKL